VKLHSASENPADAFFETAIQLGKPDVTAMIRAAAMSLFA